MKNNKIEKFNQIYNETYHNILKFVICSCYNIEDVNDIIQDIYLELYKALNKKDILDFNRYVMGIAKNKIKKHYSFLYKIKENFSLKKEIDNISNDINIEQELINKMDTEFIWDYLKSKNVIIHKIFCLYYYEGLTLKEISELLKLKESNVKNLLYRTLKELNKYFKGV